MKRQVWCVGIPLCVALLAGIPEARAETSTEIPATYRKHVANLRRSLSADFTVVVVEPFVVAGNGSPEEVKRRAQHTVKWAVSRLKRGFFRSEPGRILDIFLFADDDSYRFYAKKLFGDEPDTPYGYYSSTDGALVMNIATGGGTLVHELVHPFVEADFPDAPPWLNEGLGSLFEASTDRKGNIVGVVNWRLPGLQKALRAGTVPSFSALTRYSANQFYGDASGVNYAQARYLLYYLQERGLVQRFYREFRAHHLADPTGYKTLRQILGKPDMAAFQENWKTFVLGLRWRN